MKFITAIAIVLVFGSLVFSCRKGDDGPVGGKGGSSVIRATNRHHANYLVVTQGMVLIKYNAIDKPVDDIYDDSVASVLVNGVPVSVFSGLKPGNYYLYGHGYDTSLGKTVVGGTPVTLPYDGIDTSLYVPVTEGD